MSLRCGVCWMPARPSMAGTRRKRSALLAATHANRIDAARLLIERGANVNAKDDIERFALPLRRCRRSPGNPAPGLGRRRRLEEHQPLRRHGPDPGSPPRPCGDGAGIAEDEDRRRPCQSPRLDGLARSHHPGRRRPARTPRSCACSSPAAPTSTSPTGQGVTPLALCPAGNAGIGGGTGGGAGRRAGGAALSGCTRRAAGNPGLRLRGGNGPGGGLLRRRRRHAGLGATRRSRQSATRWVAGIAHARPLALRARPEPATVALPRAGRGAANRLAPRGGTGRRRPARFGAFDDSGSTPPAPPSAPGIVRRGRRLQAVGHEVLVVDAGCSLASPAHLRGGAWSNPARSRRGTLGRPDRCPCTDELARHCRELRSCGRVARGASLAVRG